MPAEITQHTTPLGPRWAKGSAGFISPDGATGFDSDELRSRLTGLATIYNTQAARLQPEHVAPTVREESWSATVRGAARNAFNAALTEARAARAADLGHLEPARPVDPAVAIDVAQAFRAMSRADRARAINEAALEELTALHQYGHQVPLLPEESARVLARYRVENRLVAQNAAARHPATPTVEHPLVIGPDMGAARAEVEGWEAAHRARLEAVEANEATARYLIQFLAAVYDVAPSAVLDGILGRDDA